MGRECAEGSVDTVGKGVIHTPLEQDSPGLHHSTQNGVQFKVYVFYLCNFLFNAFRLRFAMGN